MPQKKNSQLDGFFQLQVLRTLLWVLHAVLLAILNGIGNISGHFRLLVAALRARPRRARLAVLRSIAGCASSALDGLRCSSSSRLEGAATQLVELARTEEIIRPALNTYACSSEPLKFSLCDFALGHRRPLSLSLSVS